jgi:hypothetical protein
VAVKDLYELDFFEWTQQNAELRRNRWLSEIDVDNLAEQVADMGRRDRRETDSYLTRLILPLLKWQMQPALGYGQSGRSSWLNSIVHSRVMPEKIFEQSPSPKRLAEESLSRNYPAAVRARLEST